MKQRAVYTKIADCRQEEGEEVRKYLERLKEVFEAHSGIDKPNPPDHAGPFEQQLKNAFLTGMNGQLAGFVKKHNITWKTDDLESETICNTRRKRKRPLNFTKRIEMVTRKIFDGKEGT